MAVSFTLTTDLSKLTQRVMLLNEQQLRRTVAFALQRTAGATHDFLKARISDPSGPIEGGATRWTLGGTTASRFVKPADLSAYVGFRSDTPRAAGRYLRPIMQGAQPVTKAIDLKLSQGRSGIRFTPSRALPRTAQGNISRSTIGSQILAGGASGLFARPLKGTSTLGVFRRVESRIARTSTYESDTRFLGVLSSGRPRRRTLDLPDLLWPTIQQQFNRHLASELQVTLRKAGVG